MRSSHSVISTSRLLSVGAVMLCSGLALTAPAQAAGERNRHHAAAGSVASKAGRTADGVSCSAAFNEAQEKQRTAHLREARDLLFQCAQPACPKMLRHRCLGRYAQLDADMPSLVPVVTDESGAPHTDVEVKMDGAPFASRIDGLAIPVDPGVHELSFSVEGRVFATTKIMVAQGQRNRTVAVSIPASVRAGREARGSASKAAVVTAAPAADRRRADSEIETESAEPAAVVASAAPAPAPETDAPPPASPRSRTAERTSLVKAARADDEEQEEAAQPKARAGRSVLPYVLAAVGVAGVGGYGLLTYWGRKDNDQLGACAPLCSQASVDHIDRLYLAADISLGVGIVALGAATWLWVRQGSSESESPSRAAAYRFGVRPTRSGAVAALSGSF